MAERSAGVRRAAVVIALLVGFAPECCRRSPDAGSGLDPNVTPTVTPDDLVADAQAVVVTGAGFPPNTQGTLRPSLDAIGRL